MKPITEHVGGVTYEYQPITDEAAGLVFGDRNQAYGHPAEDFSKTAGLWSIYKGVAFTPEDVAEMMVMVKISRQMHQPKRDNVTDAVGYNECLQRIIAAREAGVEMTDWSTVAPTVDYLLGCQRDQERLYTLMPPGATLEDIIACWEAHHPGPTAAATEELPDRLCLDALQAAKARGIQFSEGQENMFLCQSLINRALRENWSVFFLNNRFSARGWNTLLYQQQWDALRDYARSVNYEAKG